MSSRKGLGVVTIEVGLVDSGREATAEAVPSLENDLVNQYHKSQAVYTTLMAINRPQSSSSYAAPPMSSGGTASIFTSSEQGTSMLEFDQKPSPADAGFKSKTRSKTPRWLTQFKDWLSVAEPSAVAMRQQKKATFQRHGIALDDPRAAAKLHYPMGEVPTGIVTSTSGPTPEEALKRKTRESRAKSAFMEFGHPSQSLSSVVSSASPSIRGNPVAPWDH